MNLPQPLNQTAEILYELINSKVPISYSQIYHATATINLGQRISDLRKAGLKVYCKEVETTNKHGRKISYGTWSIAGEEQLALEVYNRINQTRQEKVAINKLAKAIIPAGEKVGNEKIILQ